MTGRQEHSEIMDAKTRKLLIGQSKILTDYYYSFTDNSSFTKKAYIKYVIEFFGYLKENGIAVSIDGLTNLRTSDINRYMDAVKYSTKDGERIERKEVSRAVRLYAISNFFEFMIDEGYMSTNPCARVDAPKCSEEKEIVAMTPKDIKLLKKNIIAGVGSARSISENKKWVNRNLAIVSLGCTTGLRVSSITEINISDIDFQNQTIIVREKGNKERTIYFGENTKKELLDWLADRRRLFPGIDTDALFISKKRKRLSQRSIADMLEHYSVGINKHITPHKMRSSCATNLYEKTGDIYLVQQTLGHKNIANTRRYAKLSEERRRKAVELLDK